MPRVRKDSEPEVPFFHIQIVDAEGGKIRFGPFTAEEFNKYTTGGEDALPSPAQMVKDFQDDIRDVGLITALTSLGIWGGLTIFLKGDEGTDLPLWDYPPPGIIDG